MNFSYEAGKYVAYTHLGIMNLNWFYDLQKVWQNSKAFHTIHVNEGLSGRMIPKCRIKISSVKNIIFPLVSQASTC